MTPYESSMSTVHASVWYSLHSFLLLYFLWVLFYRRDRADRLRSDLSVIRWELSDSAGSHPAWTDLMETAQQAEHHADRLTVTRLLGAWLMAGNTQGASCASADLIEARGRITSAVAVYTRLPILSDPYRGFAALQIAIETASLDG